MQEGRREQSQPNIPVLSQHTNLGNVVGSLSTAPTSVLSWLKQGSQPHCCHGALQCLVRIVRSSASSPCQPLYSPNCICGLCRLSTVRNADLTIVMADGRIAERGTHAALLTQQGIYAQLVRRQTDGGAPPLAEDTEDDEEVSSCCDFTVREAVPEVGALLSYGAASQAAWHSLVAAGGQASVPSAAADSGWSSAAGRGQRRR